MSEEIPPQDPNAQRPPGSNPVPPAQPSPAQPQQQGTPGTEYAQPYAQPVAQPVAQPQPASGSAALVQAIRQEVTRVVRYAFTGDGRDAPAEEVTGGFGGLNTDPFIVLATVRGDRCRPMHAGADAREGDVALVLVFEPEIEEADAALADLGWTRLPDVGAAAE